MWCYSIVDYCKYSIIQLPWWDSWGQELPFVCPFQLRPFHNSTTPPLQEAADTPEHLETPLYRYCHFFSFPSFRWSLKSETAAAGWGPSLRLHQRQLHRRKAPGHPPVTNPPVTSLLMNLVPLTQGQAVDVIWVTAERCTNTVLWQGEGSQSPVYFVWPIWADGDFLCLTDPPAEVGRGLDDGCKKSISAPHNSISWYQRLANYSQSCGAEGMYVNRLTFFKVF